MIDRIIAMVACTIAGAAIMQVAYSALYGQWGACVSGALVLIAMVIGLLGIRIRTAAAARAETKGEGTEMQAFALANVLDLIPYFIFAKDRNGRFLIANKPFAAMFNMKPEDMIGRSYAEMAIDKEDELFVTGTDLQVIETGQPMSFEETYTDVNGQKHYLITNKTRCMIDGQMASLACCTDITERRKLEVQLQQSQKMHAVGQLAGGVAHDFNNLLQVILGYGEIVRRALPEEPLHGHMGHVMEAGQRAQALVGQLLAFSRRDRDTTLHVVSMAAVVEGFTRMLREMIGLETELVVEALDARTAIRADLGQIEQVLMNLCVNARDAMPEGGTLTIRTSRAYLDRRDVKGTPGALPGPYVCLSVADTGGGMPHDVAEHVFEPFYTTKAHGQGTGLGLATVYAIVERHGGVIRMQSEIDKGTTFWMYFPALEFDEEAP